MLIKFLDDYIDKLYSASNRGACAEQQGLFSKKDYYELLKPVVDAISQHKDYSIQELRDLLYSQSNIEQGIKEFILKKELAPGLVFTYGTKHFRETVIIGNKQEKSIDKNGNIVPAISQMTKDTIFDLASVTKIFTSLSILSLVHEGQVKLSDKVGKYAPEFKFISDVSIFDLLTFSVPLRTERRVDSATSRLEAEEIMYNIKVDEGNPNTMPYTDMGAMVLKYIIEHISGMDFYSFVVKKILNPLGMIDTHVKIPTKKLDRVASGNFVGKLVKDGSVIIERNIMIGTAYDPKARVMEQNEGNLSGHAGLFSTADDMAKLAKAIIKKDILNADLFTMMAKNRTGKLYKTPEGVEKYCQFLGMLCWSKHPNYFYSELFHAMSGKAFASAGWTGTQLTVDPINELFFFMAGNRSHNRLVYVDPSQKDKLITDENGKRGIILDTGEEIVDASTFAWDRDVAVVHPALKLTIQYKMLEDIIKMTNERLDEEENVRSIL